MKKVVLAVLLLCALLFTGCRSVSPVTGVWQGSWYSEELQGDVTLRYRFTEDGNVMAEGDGFSLPFGTYTVKGNTLQLTGEDDARSEFTFSIQGDKLTLYYVSGAVYATFKRAAE
ncbi:MAG: hypothetical protein J6Z79_00260 [Clostridia bacterium]|nr:hypothetical protein [Clostridia bacterium]